MARSYFCLWLLLLLYSFSRTEASTSTETPSALLPLEARSADLSGEDDVISTSYVLPNQIFNNGKPYYARQDPISGQLDFSAKKPAGIEPEANEVLDPNEKIVLSGGAPNIHDFLNLPVKYSSSKFVYPLVSSSYANLKYQGSNKNYITNKQPTSVVAPVTPPSPTSYQSANYFTVPTTRLTAVPPTAAVNYHKNATIMSSTRAPTTKSTSTSEKPKSTAETTPIPTTKYSTTRRRPVALSTTLAPLPSRTSTTRKKFVPTKKYIPTTHSTTTIRTTTNHLALSANTTRPTPSSSDKSFTTHHPTPQAPIFPTEPTTTTKIYTTSSSSPPVVFTEEPTPAFSPIPTATNRIPNLDPADVYHTLGQKNTQAQQQQQQTIVRPAMTLSDIFNSLAEEESAVAHNYQQNQGFDAQGNLIEPIAPSKPSPFAMQSQQQRPQYPTNPSNSSTAQQPAQFANEEKVISGSQENYSNEFVSYQVQLPNVMQYRPAPGQINNVVISPGQQSASFVLGSQQQVGTSNPFSIVDKEPLFAKDTSSVQYGQVINEDIANIKRPLTPNYPTASQAPVPPSSYQQMPNVQVNSNFHQNGKYGAVNTAPTSSAAFGSYQGPPPEAPTPYQQLPLIGSGSRPSKTPPPAQPQGHMQTPGSNYQLTQSSPRPQPPSTQTVVNSNDTKELLVSTNIRFPATDEESSELPSSAVAPGPPSGPHINGHAQPLSLQQIQNSNPVVFPKPKGEDTVNSNSNSNVQIQQHEVLTMNQHKQHLQFPGHNEQLVHSPSQEMEPPPAVPQTPSTSGNRPSGPSPPRYPAHNEFNRKPQPTHNGVGRPNINMNLPNILPQFRPNAKISNGHPNNYKQEPGNIQLPTQGMKRPYNPAAAGPQFAHRRQPLPQPQRRYPMNRISEYPVGPPASASDVNRRVYRLPQYQPGSQGLPYQYQHRPDRVYAPRPSSPLRAIDGQQSERHAPLATEPYKTITAESLADFEEEDLVINDPPQPVAPNKERKSSVETKLEPVVTLQMLQSQKKAVSLPNDDTGAGEIQVTADNDPLETAANSLSEHKIDNNGPLTEGDAAAAESRDPLPTGSDYQNTPFSVIRDQPQEPILKNKKPQSLQQQTKAQQHQQLTKDKFPYPIEKPDLSYTDLQPDRVPGILIAPRIINGAVDSGTEAPIAIAYTPTEPSNPYRRSSPAAVGQDLKYSNINLATSVIGEIRTDTQTEEGLSSDFDIRDRNLEKDFMAPFYPSVSLSGVGSGAAALKSPPNSWNIVPTTTDQTIYEKNNINRADIQPAEDKKDAGESHKTERTTEKPLELDMFQPELQGGFKPIYPPGYKHVEQVEALADKQMQHYESNDKPQALALVAPQTPTTTNSMSTSTVRPKTPSSSTSNASPSSAATTPRPGSAAGTEPSNDAAPKLPTSKAPVTTATPTLRKKSPFETSLAALLFGDDEELEDGARKAIVPAKPQGQAALHNLPRMGPRSLKLS